MAPARTTRGVRSPLDGQRAWVTQALATKMVRRAANALAGRARVMPVKGALLARCFYDDPAERPLTDCDVVVWGLSARAAARVLVNAGMQVATWSNDPHIVDMIDPQTPGIHLDVHARPLPAGYGAVTATWMCEGAREDHALFGASVLLPDDGRTLVHLLGNILHDHVYNAPPHTSRDVALVLARSPWSVERFATVIRSARLRLGCWAALGYVAERTDAPRAHALREALALSPTERAYVEAKMRILARSRGRTPPPIVSRVVARAVSDAPRDVAEGFATALYGVVHARLAKGLR